MIKKLIDLIDRAFAQEKIIGFKEEGGVYVQHNNNSEEVVVGVPDRTCSGNSDGDQPKHR